jgi:hypothetical protein
MEGENVISILVESKSNDSSDEFVSEVNGLFLDLVELDD